MDRELELLRGETIGIIPPVADIPCTETSDANALCKSPVVSVRMITYNHAQFIRQAIESVVSQKTNFPFELIIGEDCSSDETRAICFEYQKRYPEIIRVLWSERNVGGAANDRRVASRCRGEFQAWCEGDDYWCDPNKLQKQVDAMRSHPTVGICVACHKEFSQRSGLCYDISDTQVNSCFLKGIDYVLWETLRVTTKGGPHWKRRPFQTSTMLVRSSSLIRAKERFAELFNWQLRLNDTLHFLSLCSVSDMYYTGDCLSVYRLSDVGISHREPDKMYIDAIILKLKALSIISGASYALFWPYYKYAFLRYVVNIARTQGRGEGWRRIRQSSELQKMFVAPRNWLIALLLLMMPRNLWLYNHIMGFYQRFLCKRPNEKTMTRIVETLRRCA